MYIMGRYTTEEKKENRRIKAREWANNNKDKIKEQHKNYYLKNKEKVLARNKEWKEANREKFREMQAKSYHRTKSDPTNTKKYLLKHAKARAVQKQIDFTLVESDIVLPDVCPILGLPFDRGTRKYGYSLDRKDPNKGYTKDNVWVISQIANAMKWDSTHEERILFAKWVLSLEGGVLP